MSYYYTTHVESAQEAQQEIYFRYARIKASINPRVDPVSWRERVNKEAVAAWSALAKCNLKRWKVIAPALLLSAIHHIHEDHTPDATPATLSDDPEPFRDTRWRHWLGKDENHNISGISLGEDRWWMNMQAGSSTQFSLPAMPEQRRRTRSDSPDRIEEENPTTKKRKTQQDGAGVGNSRSNSPHLRRSERLESISAIPAKQNTVDISDSSDYSHSNGISESESNYSDSSGSTDELQVRGPSSHRVKVVKPVEQGLPGVYNPACSNCRRRDELCEVILRADSSAGPCVPCKRRKDRCSAFGSECEVIPLNDTLRVSPSLAQGSAASALKRVESTSSMTSVTNPRRRDDEAAKRMEDTSSKSSRHQGDTTVSKPRKSLSSMTSAVQRPRYRDEATESTSHHHGISRFLQRVQNPPSKASASRSRHEDNAIIPKRAENTMSKTCVTSPRHSDNETVPRRIENHHDNATIPNTTPAASGENLHHHDGATIPSHVRNSPVTAPGTNLRHVDNPAVSKPSKNLSPLISVTQSRHQDKATANRSEATGNSSSETQSRHLDKAVPAVDMASESASSSRALTTASLTDNGHAQQAVRVSKSVPAAFASASSQGPTANRDTGYAEPVRVSSVPAPSASASSSRNPTASDAGHAESVGSASVSSTTKGKEKEKEKSPKIPSERPSPVLPLPVTPSPTPAAGTEEFFQKISKLVTDEISRLRSTVQDAVDCNTDKTNKRVTMLQEELRISQLELEERMRAEFVSARPQATSSSSNGVTAAPAASTSNSTDTEVIAHLLSEVTEIRGILNHIRIENANLSDANQYLRQRIAQADGRYYRNTQGPLN